MPQAAVLACRLLSEQNKSAIFAAAVCGVRAQRASAAERLRLAQARGLQQVLQIIRFERVTPVFALPTAESSQPLAAFAIPTLP